MRRLIWGFAGCTYHIVGNLCHGSNRKSHANIICIQLNFFLNFENMAVKYNRLLFIFVFVVWNKYFNLIFTIFAVSSFTCPCSLVAYIAKNMDPDPAKVIKLVSYSTQLSMKFILLINVKMPTISTINTTSERLKARNFIICKYFCFYEQLKFHAQLSWAWKKF